MISKTRLRMLSVPFTKVTVKDGFWQPRIETNRRVTLPIEYRQCKRTGRIDAWDLNWKPGEPKQPHYYWDSDVAKWLEAAAYSLATHSDPKLEARVDDMIARIAKAQQPDGYLNIYFTVVAPEKRWTNLRDWHELYCAGHLMEAAVAYHAATGKRLLLDVLCRYADHIAAVFGPRAGQKRGYPGHEEVELALCKLHRATGERRYLELAKFFVDERGRRPNYFDLEAQARGDTPLADYETRQAHRPVREQDAAEGHAVRALYLYSGMADLAAATGDGSLLAACRRLWKSVTGRRLYVTGGVGSSRKEERFTFDYDLPNETAYAETCASIALVFFAHRMLHLEADSRYADVMEQTLYNGVLSGVSLDGKKFFYANPLAVFPEAFRRRPGEGSGHLAPTRQEWFDCSCCPPNIARLLASFGGYVYSASAHEAYVHLYVGGAAEFSLGGVQVTLRQTTAYPWRETVRIDVAPQSPLRFALALRIPGWCRGARLRVNGKTVELARTTRRGYARIAREWTRGDRVELTLPMPVERIEAHPRVRMNHGFVALRRGPVVYCLEEVDNGANLAALSLPREAKLRAVFNRRLLGGAVAITGRLQRRLADGWDGALYRPRGATRERSVSFRAVPYCLWNNRGDGEMRVWIREC